MPELVFDVETRKSFDDVGGRGNFHLLEISVVGAYDYASDRFLTYTEETIGEFEKLLIKADRVVGFNTKGFDYAVLQPYVSINLKALPSLDIMEELANVLGHRVSLDSVASATLKSKKTGDGLKAIQLWREGKVEELADYCLQDVKLTRDIYDYGASHGKLFYEHRFGGAGEAPVTWRRVEASQAPLRLAL